MLLSPSPKPIDPQLRELVEEIEKQSPTGVSVLAARQFRYSVDQTPVEVTISAPRKFNVLEEFILRAGSEFDPPTTADDLADLLGFDPVFVRNTTRNLRALQTLAPAGTDKIELTAQGRQFYEQGSVPQPPQTKKIYAVADPLRGNLVYRSSPLQETQIDLPDLKSFISIENRCGEVTSLPLEELQRLVIASGLGLHVPEDGKILTAAQVTDETQTIWQPISIIVSFDALEDAVRVQVRRGKTILQYASDLLDILQAEGTVSLQGLLSLTDETIAAERETLLNKRNQYVEARLDKIQLQALATAKELRAAGDNTPPKETEEKGTAILLRDSLIRPTFLSTLKSGRHDILIYSPWVTQEVVDSEFIELLQNLANRGVWVLIGHGIARKQEDEDRPIPPEVEAQLREVKTPEGLPAVQVFWLGNSHAKEIVVDGKIHLCGSQNWLSYRGDRLPRGETAYKVTSAEQVGEAYKFLASRFQSYAQKSWNKARQNRDAALAEVPLCIWGALGMEKVALNQIQKNSWLELMPVWLKVVRQGLRSKKISPDSEGFGTALSLLSQISAELPNVDLLREGWQKVLGAIAGSNREMALTLLNDEVWAEFVRLGIAPPAIDSPVNFIATYASAQKQPVNKSKGDGKKSSKNKGKKNK
ncbi:hypothetical protein [Kamptonema formosum]|uniref:hypothetical protein n=1 Tax=Kamptonema formosum TaxID=331992 RepID=UPI00034921F2|nr:hypothetical protein [Oscillatoria sp. PCC 10802]